MAPKGKGKKKKAERKAKAPSGGGGPGPAAAAGPATHGESSQQREASSAAAPEAEAALGPAGPEPGDRGQLAGLRSRPDLNGRRVEVQGPAAGKDGAPRLAVRLLFGAGAGTVLKVKVANLELDKDCTLDPALATLVTEMQALAPGAVPPEERRDWAGLPVELLAKIAETHIARTEAGWVAWLKEDPNPDVQIQPQLEERRREGNCLFVFAMVCRLWRKAQLKVGGRLRTRVESDVIQPGRAALVKWALAEGCPRDHPRAFRLTLFDAAAMHGQLELVRWLIQEQGFKMDMGTISVAARSGNLELVQWLRGEGCDWSVEACGYAACRGKLEVLQWLRANGCPWDTRTCTWAAQNNYLETLRWARENGCDWSTETCKCAAVAGNLEVLQWLRANGCPWHIETGNIAALHGHLETLRWTRENGYDWNAKTCYCAAYGGYLEVLQWLRAEGCPWDWRTCHCAVKYGHVEVLRWARENGSEWDAATRDRAAAELGYTDDLGNLV